MRRRASSLLAAAIACAALVAYAPQSASASIVPSPAAAPSGLCHLAGAVPTLGGALEGGCEAALTPLKLAEWLTKKGWGALGSVLGEVPKKLVGAVATVVKDGANAALNGVSGWIASGAVWLVSKVAGLLQSTTSPNVTASWFRANYGVMLRIAFMLALPLLLLGVGRALFMRDPGELVRSALVYLPLAGLLTAGAVAVTQMGITITDALSESVSHAVGADAHQFFQSAAKGLIVLGAGSASPALPGFVVAIAAILAAFAAFVLWIELVLRSAAIYVVLLFMPLAFVAMVWPTTARLARRMVEILAAIVLAKFVIVTIIALAASAMLHAGLGGNVDAAFAGIALMLLAIFAPWTLLRMLPLLEAALVHHEGASRQARAWTSDRVRDRASEHIKSAFGEVAGSGARGEGAALIAGAGRPARDAGGALAHGPAPETAAGAAGAAATGGTAALGAVAGTAAANAAVGRVRTGGAAAQSAIGASAGAASPARARQPDALTDTEAAASGAVAGERPTGQQGHAQAAQDTAAHLDAASTPNAEVRSAPPFPTAVPAGRAADGGSEGAGAREARASAPPLQPADVLQSVEPEPTAGAGGAPAPMPAMPSELNADRSQSPPAVPAAADHATPEVQVRGRSVHRHPADAAAPGEDGGGGGAKGPDELIPAEEIERDER